MTHVVTLIVGSPIAASVIAVIPGEDLDGGEGDLGDEGGAITTTTDAATTTVTGSEESFVRGLAGTVGIATPSPSWIVPMDTLPNNQTTMWILNSGADAVNIDLEPLGEVDFHGGAQSLVVDPGSILGVEIDVGIGIFGYHVSADGPVSVAWEMSGERGAALVVGIPDQ